MFTQFTSKYRSMYARVSKVLNIKHLILEFENHESWGLFKASIAATIFKQHLVIELLI